MKRTIFNFDQEKASKINGLDISDLLLLEYIMYAVARPNMIHTVITDESGNDVSYVWLKYSKIVEDLPILRMKEDTIYRRLTNLKSLGLIKSVTKNDDRFRGSRCYYTITSECDKLLYSKDNEQSENNPSENNPSGQGEQSENNPSGKSRAVGLFSAPDTNINNNKELDKDTELGECSQPTEKDLKKKEIAEKYVSDYISICTDLPQPKKLTQSRIDSIYRLCSKYDYEDVLNVLHKANASDFLSGRSGRWTNIGFDWLLNERNFIKILEGNYDNKGGNQYRKESVFGEYQAKTNKVDMEGREDEFLSDRIV